MQYPLISEYIESVKDADNFATLTNLRPVLDGNGYSVMSSGNFAVVFKIINICDNKIYAIKCFTRKQEEREWTTSESVIILKELTLNTLQMSDMLRKSCLSTQRKVLIVNFQISYLRDIVPERRCNLLTED